MAGKPADSCSRKIGSNEKEKSKSDRRKAPCKKSLSLEEKEGFIGFTPKGFISKNICKMDCSMTGKGKFCLSGGKCNAIINRHINVLYLRE